MIRHYKTNYSNLQKEKRECRWWQITFFGKRKCFFIKDKVVGHHIGF